ncbi:MAG: HD domain-containing protein, partial [Minisyncoccia bacterium]
GGLPPVKDNRVAGMTEEGIDLLERAPKRFDERGKEERGEAKNMKISIIEKAARIAVIAHGEQKRKGDNFPYIIHPVLVALKLAKYNFPDTVIAAALTHDVLEDTDFDEEKLKKELGDEVLEIVKAVTNDDSLSWEEKKKKYIETVRKGSEGAKAVAVADKIHNLESLLIAYEEQGPELWKKFNRGKEQKIWFESEVLKMLKQEWQHPLIDEYASLLEKVKSLD